MLLGSLFGRLLPPTTSAGAVQNKAVTADKPAQAPAPVPAPPAPVAPPQDAAVRFDLSEAALNAVTPAAPASVPEAAAPQIGPLPVASPAIIPHADETAAPSGGPSLQPVPGQATEGPMPSFSAAVERPASSARPLVAVPASTSPPAAGTLDATKSRPHPASEEAAAADPAEEARARAMAVKALAQERLLDLVASVGRVPKPDATAGAARGTDQPASQATPVNAAAVPRTVASA